VLAPLARLLLQRRITGDGRRLRSLAERAGAAVHEQRRADHWHRCLSPASRPNGYSARWAAVVLAAAV
jgi:hypothetical protein